MRRTVVANPLRPCALDHLAGLTAAWSVARRLRNDYKGPLVRIRRSSDDTERDIGYTRANLLDTSVVSAFIGAGSGFIVTLYDQIGSRNFTQATAAQQPAYAASGIKDKAAGDWDGSDDGLALGSGLNLLNAVAGATIIAAVKADATPAANAAIFFGSINSAASSRTTLNHNATPVWTASGRRLDADSSASALGTAADTNADVLTAIFNYANSDAFIRKNGAQIGSNTGFQTNGNTSATDSGTIRLGSVSSITQIFNGRIAEVVLAASVLSTPLIQQIERNVGAFYGVVVA